MAVFFISGGTVSGVHILIDCLCERRRFKCLSREDLMYEAGYAFQHRLEQHEGSLKLSYWSERRF
jgi:hypothetical protein